jgi:ABC-type branched-subunit amino acid transport system substrate-binding protein
MMRLNRSKKAITLTALAASVALAATMVPAQASTDKVGVTSTTIKLGISQPTTGPASAGYNKVAPAMNSYFKYVNDNGGINGRKIELIIKNDGYVVQRAVNESAALVDEGVFALVGSLGTANNAAVAEFLDLKSTGLPSLFVNTGFSGFSVKKDYPTMFSLFPSYYMEAKIFSEYIKKNFPGKKVGVIYQADDFGVDALAGLAQGGITLAEKISYASLSQGTPSVGQGWITKLKAANVEVVVFYGVPTAVAAALRTAAALAYKPQWIVTSVGSDYTTLSGLGVTNALLDGVVTASFLPASTDDADPYVKLFKEIHTKYGTGTFDNNILTGMNTAMMTANAIKAAGPNLTRSGLIRAIETKGRTFASASLTPPTYSTTSHAGYAGFWVAQINSSGVMVPESGKYKVYTTDAGKGAVKVSTYKRPAMPAKGLPK